MDCLVLTELTLPRLLWCALTRRACGVIGSLSLIRGASTEHLDRIAAWLARRGRVVLLAQQHPHLVHHHDAGDLMRLTDVFGECEGWLAERMDFASADRRFGIYGRAYRHVCCNVGFRRFDLAYRIEGFREVIVAGSRLLGLDSFSAAFHRYRFGDAIKPQALSIGGFVINAVLAAGALVLTASSIVRRLRLAPKPAEEVFLGSEHVGFHDLHVWEELVETPRQLVIVARNDAQYCELRARLGDERRMCRHDDGVFGVAAGVACLGEAMRDIWRLWRAGRTLPPDFFRALIALPYRRAMYRALFAKYRFRHFWGRDEYNPEHMMRSVELRRIGGVSIGIMHGIPSICTVLHQIRHLDFDRFYVIGRDLYERVYRSTWPAAMQVRAIGSHGASRRMMRLLAETPARDISCFLSPCFHQDRIISAVAGIAEALPDRTIFVNVKKALYLKDTFGQAIERLRAKGLPNIAFHEGSSYELLLRCRYVINESSTLTAEAIQFGRTAFILDLDNRFKALYYRRFPGICVTSADEAVKRIRGLEDGGWTQPRHLYGDLIEMGPRMVWDVIREDFGLRPRASDDVNRPSEAAVAVMR